MTLPTDSIRRVNCGKQGHDGGAPFSLGQLQERLGGDGIFQGIEDDFLLFPRARRLFRPDDFEDVVVAAFIKARQSFLAANSCFRNILAAQPFRTT